MGFDACEAIRSSAALAVALLLVLALYARSYVVQRCCAARLLSAAANIVANSRLRLPIALTHRFDVLKSRRQNASMSDTLENQHDSSCCNRL